MTNISHEAVLSAAWMLMHRTRKVGSAFDWSDTPIADATRSDSQNRPMQLGGDEADAKEAVQRLISAYLRSPTHISSHFHCW